MHMLEPYFVQLLNAYRLVIIIGLVSVVIGSACGFRSTSEFWRAFGWCILGIGLFVAGSGGWLLFKSDSKFAIVRELSSADLLASILKEISGYQRSLAVQAFIALVGIVFLVYSADATLRGVVWGLLFYIGVISMLDTQGILREQSLMATLPNSG